MGKLRWRKRFHASTVDFFATKLEMGFENEVEIAHITNGHQDNSPKIPFNPEGEYSKEIKIEFLDPIPPHEQTLMIWFLAEKEPVFTKVIWSNTEQGRTHPFTQKQIDMLNK